jgi:hypothetical protein
VSNWTLSLLEDGLAVFLVWLASEHPFLTAVLVVLLTILAVLLIRKLWNFARHIVDRVRYRPPATQQRPRDAPTNSDGSA